MHITIPYKPRPEFLPFHDRTQRWSIGVCHRRAGKTVAHVNELIKGALTCPLQNPQFAYLAPYRTQAKDTAWRYLKQFSMAVPGTKPNESDLFVDFPNGGRVRLYGADNYDAMRGIYLDGVVLDEYADMDPRVWPEVIRPALSDRKGWGAFIGTPKGRGDFYRMYEDAKASPEWFAFMLKASETGIVDEAELRDASGTMTPEQYQQEYECSFEAAVVGAYYGRLMAAAEADKRVTGVPYDPAAQVYTAWDLGIGDATSIWFCQIVGREVHIIDFYEASGADLGHYVREIRSRPYIYAGHFLPHDARARELGTGKTRLETLDGLGLSDVTICPDHRVEDGINAVRMLLPRCWFDRDKCVRGIDALKLYRAEYDDKLQTLKPRPVHDWTSHPADAFRYLAMALDTNPVTASRAEPRHNAFDGGWMG